MSQKPYLHSHVSASAARARVYLATQTRSEFLANVFRADGFWHVVSTSGARLMPMLPHTKSEGRETTEIPLVAVLKLLRDTVRGTLSTTNAAAGV
jgi:hypothetical protein